MRDIRVGKLMHYRHWTITNNSVKAVGGVKNVYTHYCPLDDFFLIIRAILKRYKKQNSIKPAEIMNDLDKVKLSSGRVFNKKTHEYKVYVTLFVLVKKGFLKRVERGKYVMEKNGEELEKWVRKLKKRELRLRVEK